MYIAIVVRWEVQDVCFHCYGDYVMLWDNDTSLLSTTQEYMILI